MKINFAISFECTCETYCIHTLIPFFFQRLIFFHKPPDDGRTNDLYFYEDKLKESRRQLLPLAQILDLPENRTGDKIVGQAMLDFRDVKESERVDSDSSCSQSLFDDCSLSEDINEESDSN